MTYGDRSGGGPGSRAQTFLETKRYFWVAVDAAGDGSFTTLANSPYLTIVGGEAVEARSRGAIDGRRRRTVSFIGPCRRQVG